MEVERQLVAVDPPSASSRNVCRRIVIESADRIVGDIEACQRQTRLLDVHGLVEGNLDLIEVDPWQGR